MNSLISKIILILIFPLLSAAVDRPLEEWLLPIDVPDRKAISSISLTEIGEFGLMRVGRPGIPAHYHTGIDIKRPKNNYDNEPVYPTAVGRVISIRNDGPFAQIIIEHVTGERGTLWSVYEHIAGIRIRINDIVDPRRPIARFMNEEELNRYGWQFDHFHFELMKTEPVPLKFDEKMPEHKYRTYSLVCYQPAELKKHYYDTISFFIKRWGNAAK